MTVVHIPTHGLLINGVVYQASGAGLHPTIVICHGLPGNEKNLDLAQAARRRSLNICASRPTLPLWESTRAGLYSRVTAWAVG